MKLNNREQVKPNLAGLTSSVQQAEMKLILAGAWPPLKPLPIFKYAADEYRAEIHFDGARGEWVCSKTSFPSNKVQELRGGLIEMTMTLPRGQSEVFTEAVAAEPLEQELESEANRRLQAILEWKENHGNGTLYSELQRYLSERQQEEIYDSIRMSLTARQLQYNAKNVAFIFDALCNAGGRLAALIEIAQRNRAEREPGAQSQAEAATLEPERPVSVEATRPTSDRRLQMRTTPASIAHVMFGETNSGVVLNISETGMAVAAADHLAMEDHLAGIRIQLPNSSQSIEISAEIVWLVESKKGAGMRFVDLTADARTQISDWIASERAAPVFEQLPKLLRRDNQPLEISSRKSRRIFSNPSDRDEEAAARYAEMFPSESTYATRTIALDEINRQQGPLQITPGTDTDVGASVCGSVAQISAGDIPQSLAAVFPSERTKSLAPERMKSLIPELIEIVTPGPVRTPTAVTLENIATEPGGSVSPDRVQTSSPDMIARTAPQASEIVAREILDATPRSPVGDLQEKVHQRAPVPGLGPQVRAEKIGSSADRFEGSPSQFRVFDISGFQVAAFVFLFAVIGFTVGLTVGRGPVGKLIREAQKSILAVDATSPALPNRPGEMTSPIPTPPAANASNTDAANPRPVETKDAPGNSSSSERPSGPSPPVTSRSLVDSENSSDANKPDNPKPPEEKSRENTRDTESFAKVPSTDQNSSPSIESNLPANSAGNPERNDTTGLIARNMPRPASPKPTLPAQVVSPMRDAPRNPDPRWVAPTTRTAPRPSLRSTILVSVPPRGSKSFRLTFPEEPIAATSSFAMSSQLSVLVPPEPGAAVARKPARLQVGELDAFAWPRYLRPGDRYGSPQTVKVRATIGKLGQVLNIRLLSGSTSLLPATMTAIRQWRYKPTLLNGRPVQAQQDITIEFQPPKHLSRVSAHHSSRN